ncbi:MAG TPA: NBR1-Ig-like domain-containing protein, partial [Anaerolineaceae bacterium]|nr:NBR1-Ig-like domain-containing protein [Anaerolineaceae bacterium]
MKRVTLFSVLAVLLIALSACNLTKQYGNSSDPSMVSTYAMQTVQALATEQAFATLVSNATDVSNLPTAIVIEGTQQSTQNPTEPVISNSPTPTTFITPLPSFTPVPMDKAGFEKDVTIPDDTVIAADTSFTKTWRLKNTGQTTWTSDYEVVFSSGNAMGGNASYKIGTTVRPGETIDISIEMKSPSTTGKYTGEWMLRNTNGRIFGMGDNADKSFWVKIQVQTYTSESV